MEAPKGHTLRFATIQCVWSFEEDKQAILALGSAVLDLAKLLNGKVNQLNVAETMPGSLPRLMIQANDVLVSFAPARLEVLVRPPAHIAQDASACYAFVQTVAGRVFEQTGRWLQRYEWCGVVSNIEFPMEGLIEATERAELFFDRVMKVPRNDRKLAAAQVQYGFFEDGLARLVTLQAFETKEVLDPSALATGVAVSVDRLPSKLTGSGLELYLDTNNKRAQHRATPMEDLAKILKAQEASIPIVIHELSLDGVLV